MKSHESNQTEDEWTNEYRRHKMSREAISNDILAAS